MAQHDARWWGEFSVPGERWGRWRIGPLSLWARPLADEWRLAWLARNDTFAEGIEVEIPAAEEPDTEACSTARYALQAPGTGLQLMPRLADLPVVVRPETPVWIPPGERTLLFVGTVVWIVVTAAGEQQRELMEMPILRPSDTWFGANTRFGEMCYANTTRARTRVELLGNIPHRAVTPVEIVNEGTDNLNIEQLRIPVTALSLYETPSDHLWTSSMRFTRQHGLGSAEFDILDESAHLPADSVKIAEARSPLQRKSVIHAFSSLFS